MLVLFKLSVANTLPFAVRIDVVLLYSNLSATISVFLSVFALPPLCAFNKLPFSKISISGVSKIISSPKILFIVKRLKNKKNINKIILFFI